MSAIFEKSLYERCMCALRIERAQERNPLGLSHCVYQRLNSAILVVKATENWVGRDGTEALDRAMERRVLVHGTMDPQLIVVDGAADQQNTKEISCHTPRTKAAEASGPRS